MSEPRTVLLLRHGRTAWNLERRIQGQLDSGLDDVGVAQARAAAERIAAYRPALLWSSDLSRARDTAVAVGEATGLEVVTDPRLREYHLGSLQGTTYDEIAETMPEVFAGFRRGDYAAADGESTAEVAARVSAALRDLLAVVPPGGLGVAVSHGAAIRVGLAELMGWDAAVGVSLGALGNCCWAVVTESEADGPLRLNAYNREAPPDFAPSPSVG